MPGKISILSSGSARSVGNRDRPDHNRLEVQNDGRLAAINLTRRTSKQV